MNKIYIAPSIKALSLGLLYPLASSPLGKEENGSGFDDEGGEASSKSFIGTVYDDEEDTGSGSAW